MQLFYTGSDAFTHRVGILGVPTQYDVTDTRDVSIRLLEAVADYRGVDPLELRPPLSEVVDPEALEALFAPTVAGAKRCGRIELTYADCRITITGGDDRTITVADVPSGPDSNREPERLQLVDRS